MDKGIETGGETEKAGISREHSQFTKRHYLVTMKQKDQQKSKPNLEDAINGGGGLVGADHEEVHGLTNVILDVDGFDGGVGVEQFGDEQVVPSRRNLQHFVGAKGVLVAGEQAHDQLQLGIQIEDAWRGTRRGH